jgi:phosphatidylinositol glycan class U
MFVVVCMITVCAVLAPILRYLWIYSGSANANFYFAISLAFSTAQVEIIVLGSFFCYRGSPQIFLVTDLLYAFLKREFHLLNGSKPPIINGKTAEVVLG